MHSPRGFRVRTRLSRAAGGALLFAGVTALAASGLIAGSGVMAAGAQDCTGDTTTSIPLAPAPVCPTTTTVDVTTTSSLVLPPGPVRMRDPAAAHQDTSFPVSQPAFSSAARASSTVRWP